MADDRSIEIRITTRNNKRLALYRIQGADAGSWRQMPVRQAEKALRDGVVSVGLIENARALPA